MNFSTRKISPFFKAQTNEALNALSAAIEHDEKSQTSPPKKKIKVWNSSDALLDLASKENVNSKNQSHKNKLTESPKKRETQFESKLPAFLFAVSEVKPGNGVVEVVLKRLESDSTAAEIQCILADSW